MRVLVMDTGRGIDADKVAMWRAHLGLGEGDFLSLVSWFQPRMHLPLARHLVCGPALRPEPTDWPLQELRTESLTESLAEVHEAPAPADAAPAKSGTELLVADASEGLSTSELDEQLTEQEADPSQAAAADQEPPAKEDPWEGEEPGTEQEPAPPAPDGDTPVVLATDLSHLPVHDLRRLRQAIRWRRKRAQRRASRMLSRQVRRVRRARTGAMDLATDWRHLPRRAKNLPTTALARAVRARKDGISWEFAVATARSSAVNDLFRAADLVVPVDQRSQKAAWLLARRHAGPDVFVTLPSAARALAARRSPR